MAKEIAESGGARLLRSGSGDRSHGHSSVTPPPPPAPHLASALRRTGKAYLGLLASRQ